MKDYKNITERNILDPENTPSATPFRKENFNYSSGWLMYQGYHHDTKKWFNIFIARFKYSQGPIGASAMKTELCKNHSIEKYATELTNGETPMGYFKKFAPEFYAKKYASYKTRMMKKYPEMNSRIWDAE